MNDRITTEGVELPFGANGPMPPDAVRHLSGVVNDVHKRKKAKKQRTKLKLRRVEELDAISDAVVASALVAADEEIEQLIAERASLDAARPPAPPLPDAEKARRVAECEAAVRVKVRDARADGVKITIPKPEAFPGE